MNDRNEMHDREAANAREIGGDRETGGDPSQGPPLPTPSERMPLKQIPPLHPALLPLEELLRDCELRTQRRSGPGGQHRNKTSSGVFLTHRPTQIVAEATERRSQARNRAVAVGRLRYRLAVELRTPSAIGTPPEPRSAELRDRYRQTSLKLNEANVDKPAVLALLMDDLHAAGGQARIVADLWQVSSTAVLNLVRSYREAFVLLNAIRDHHGRRPLK